MKAEVIVLRGVSGVGKSTFQKTFYPEAIVCSADAYFINDKGEYHFDGSKLSEAHACCMRIFINSCKKLSENGDARSWANYEAPRDDYPIVVVDNTNISVIEIAPYIAVAQAYGIKSRIITLTVEKPETAAARNVHGVPDATVKTMMVRMMDAQQQFPSWWRHKFMREIEWCP
jgi:predicted kinase